METLTLLLQGFVQCFTFERMLACVAGVLVGTLTGVLPGIGVTGAMALLLPISFGMDATTALILFAGICNSRLALSMVRLEIPSSFASSIISVLETIFEVSANSQSNCLACSNLLTFGAIPPSTSSAVIS